MRRGVTLIEVLVVMTILVLLVMAMISGLNPIYQVNKGKDATRKKDLKRISIAFEEYYNDKGCYPDAAVLADLMNQDNCKTNIASFPQLAPWPCDPDGQPYNIEIENASCVSWFTAVTRLVTEGAKTMCNYGVASTNKDWRERDDNCVATDYVAPTTAPVPPTATLTPIPCVPDPGPCFLQISGSCNSLAPAGCIGSSCCLNDNCSEVCNPAPVCGCGPQ